MRLPIKCSLVAAACLAATVFAGSPARPPYLGGIDTLPAEAFRQNLAIAIRIHREADAARMARAVAEAFEQVGYAGLGPRTAAIMDAERRDRSSEAGDVLNAIGRFGNKGAGGESEVAKRYYAVANAYGRAYAGSSLLTGNPRPWQVTPLIRRDPRLGVDYSVGSPAYPSGHTTDGYAQSLLLAMIFPGCAQPLLARASDYADSRIVLGVHYPLDVIGGRILATSSVVRLLNARSTAFGVARPREFAAAAAILRAGVARGNAATDVACDLGGAVPYLGRTRDRAAYRSRLTYGMTPVAATDRPAIVPRGAEILLATRFPWLDAWQRRDVLATTEIPSGQPLDDGSGYARLDLFAAAGGYGAFPDDVAITIPAGSDVFSNDIRGPGRLTKSGGGTLVLTGNNSFTGGISIREGTLAAGTSGLGHGPVRNDATLRLDVPVDALIGNTITGHGRIIKTGAGTLELSAISGFRGTIIVKAGQVRSSPPPFRKRRTIGSDATQSFIQWQPETGHCCRAGARVKQRVAFSPPVAF